MILLQKDTSDQDKLRKTYDEELKRSLVTDLERLGDNDDPGTGVSEVRRLARAADKI